MAIQTYNLGVITAYGDAVAGGYTGTKAEWQALMASYGSVGEQAHQDAQTATEKAGEASASADRAEAAEWGLPYADQIYNSVFAVHIFLGSILGISSLTYKKDGDANA